MEAFLEQARESAASGSKWMWNGTVQHWSRQGHVLEKLLAADGLEAHTFIMEGKGFTSRVEGDWLLTGIAELVKREQPEVVVWLFGFNDCHQSDHFVNKCVRWAVDTIPACQLFVEPKDTIGNHVPAVAEAANQCGQEVLQLEWPSPGSAWSGDDLHLCLAGLQAALPSIASHISTAVQGRGHKRVFILADSSLTAHDYVSM
jgi:hypothetical protein